TRTHHTLLATRLHRSGFSRGFESVDTGHEIVPLSLGWKPVSPVRAGVALRALSAILAISARIALGPLVALRALRTPQIRAIDTIHNNGGAIPGNLGRVPVCTVGPVLAGVALRALRSLSSARLFNTV